MSETGITKTNNRRPFLKINHRTICMHISFRIYSNVLENCKFGKKIIIYYYYYCYYTSLSVTKNLYNLMIMLLIFIL